METHINKIPEPQYLLSKECNRCGQPLTEEYYTLQVYSGEPLIGLIPNEDARICLGCRLELEMWMENK